MKKQIVRPFYAKAFLICILVSMFWSGNAAIVLFDLNLTPTGYEYIHLADRFLSLYVFMVTGWWFIESFLTKSNASSKETPPRPIHIHTANLNLDSETLAPYVDDIKALMRAIELSNISAASALDSGMTTRSEAIKQNDKINFPALYECTTLKKVREACPCDALSRSECYAFKGQG